MTKNALPTTISPVYPQGTDPETWKTNPPDEGGGGALLSRLSLSGGLPAGSGADSWGFGALSGAAITVENDGTHNYLRGQYPIDSSGDGSGDNYIYGGYTPASEQQDLYLQFYAKMPGVKHGLKFIKFFGRNATGGSNTVANSTFGLDYTGIDMGSFQYIAYGDGTSQVNDTQNGVALYTPNYIDVGRTGPLTRTITPDPKIGTFASTDWGTGWHKFQMRLKQNSGTTAGNETNNGVVELIIDDVLYARAENIFNRHYSNGFIETIGLFGYSRGQSSAFEFHIRDGMTVSTGGYVN
jgi:hypothetical protein